MPWYPLPVIHYRFRKDRPAQLDKGSKVKDFDDYDLRVDRVAGGLNSTNAHHVGVDESQDDVRRVAVTL